MKAPEIPLEMERSGDLIGTIRAALSFLSNPASACPRCVTDVMHRLPLPWLHYGE